MTTVTYTAQNSLITTTSPVHTAGTTYELTLTLANITRNYKNVGRVHSSLGGNRQAVAHRQEESYSIQTIPLSASVYANYKEFLDSVVDGTQFSIDVDGSSASPVAVQNCILNGGYSTSVIEFNYYQLSFKVLII